MEQHRVEKVPFETSKILAIKDLLRRELEYSQEDLEELSIVETKMTYKGEDVIYFAVTEEDHLKRNLLQEG